MNGLAGCYVSTIGKPHEYFDLTATPKPGAEGIDFDELGVAEVVELLDNANMEAVVRDFGDRNPREDPVLCQNSAQPASTKELRLSKSG